MLPVAAEKPAGGSDSLKLCDARRSRPLRDDDAPGRFGVVEEDLRREKDEGGRWKPGSSSTVGNGSARFSLESAIAMIVLSARGDEGGGNLAEECVDRRRYLVPLLAML